MAFTSKTRSARVSGAPAPEPFADWDNQPAQPRDWKKIALIFGLGSLSWVATYVGMLELIQANMGDLPLLQKAIIGFAVAMLMLMIIWLLDQLFASHNLITKLSYVGGYLFLTLISIGFGFGFYWKVLESRSESTRSAEAAISQVQTSLHGASTRLAQLQTTLEGLAIISKRKAVEERVKGTSCPNSSPGDGPRRRLRDEDAARFGFSSQFVKSRIGTVNKNMGALNGDLQKVVKGARSTFDAKTGTRNEFMRGLNRKLNLTATGFNAFRTDPQLLQIRQNLAERAGRTSFPNGKGGSFSCPDTQLQTALRGVVRAIDQLPELQKPKIAAVEGSEAVIEAFRRLSATLFGVLQFKLPPSPEDLRALQQRAVQSMNNNNGKSAAMAMEGAGLSKRDYIPLAIALFVDLCLLLVSIGRPMNRLDNLIPKMRRAERGPVIGILTRFNEIHKDEEMRENFEIFRHVVFDWGGHYYVAVPMNAPYTANIHLGGGQYERINNEVGDLQTEAHLLANLFSSFEHEKIFSRVLVPLLSTKAIQKKLHAQGSKFAGSQSFRVYKFRDGAWSEIILGAVMGAARRVEGKKRRQHIEDTAADIKTPAFEGAYDRRPTVAHASRDLGNAPMLHPEDAIKAMGRFGADVADHAYTNAAAAVTPGSGETATLGTAPVDLHAVAQAIHPVAGTKAPAGNASHVTGHVASQLAGQSAGQPAGQASYWDNNAAPAARPSNSADITGFGPYGSAAAAEFSTPETKNDSGGSNHVGQTFAANNNTNPGPKPLAAPRPANALQTGGAETSNDGANIIRLPAANERDNWERDNWSGALAASLSTPEGPAVHKRMEPISNSTAGETPAAANKSPSAEAGRVNVELRERSVTYSIPVQDAAVPQSLLDGSKIALAEEPARVGLTQRLALAEPSSADLVQIEAVPADITIAMPAPAVPAPAVSIPAVSGQVEPAQVGPAQVEPAKIQPAEGLQPMAPATHIPALTDIEPLVAELEADDIEMAWDDEATVEINTSEISRRFAHGSKSD